MKKIAKILLAAAVLAGSHQAWGDDGGTVTGRYWFDNSTSYTTFTPGTLEIATDGLPEGIHAFNAYVEKDGVTSSVVSRWFVKVPPTMSVAPKVRLSVDGKPWNIVNATQNSNGIYALDLNTASLTEGIHTLNASVDFGGTLSSTVSRWFIKTLDLKPNEKYATTLSIDGKPWQTINTEVGTGGVMSLSLDMNSLPLGLHTLQAQLVTSSGVATNVRETMFMRMPTTAQIESMKGYYVIDSHIRGELDATINNGIVHLDFDASQLAAGLHSISIYLASGLGLTTSVKTAWFIKIPLGGEGVKSYEYWVNDNPATVKRVTLDKVTDPFELISLVEIDEEPFRSTSYTFAVEDGVPVTYARNDFNVHFFDSENRISMAHKSFTDTRTRREVTDIETITENIATLKPNPAGDNEIKWYRFEAEAGDSLALRVDRGAGYELYAPDATVMIQASGADATTNLGVSTTQTGTYYLAVHDVAYDSKATMYFTHIPRLAILSNTPETASEKGFLVMNMTGNGFDKLTSIALVKDGTRIEPSDMIVRDRYNIAIFFDNKEQMSVGKYDLVAKFDDGGEEVVVTKNEAIEFVGKTKADIKVEVETPRIAQTPYEIYVNISNNSTQQCWGVPVNLAFSSNEGFALQFKDFYPCDNTGTGISGEQFIQSDLLGTGEEGVFMPLVIPYIGPNETVRLTIGINSAAQQIIKTYAWNSEPWSDEFDEILADGFDLSLINNPTSTGFITAKALAYLDAFAKQHPESEAYEDQTTLPEVVTDKEQIAFVGNSIKDRIIVNVIKNEKKETTDESSKSHGVDNSGGKYDPLNSYQNTLKISVPTAPSFAPTISNYYLFFMNCMVNRPAPKYVDAYQTGDSNDMHGYTAPSGITAIGIGVKTVNYTIEFENTPEIANSSASVIKVDNTINGKVFDLASFKPQKMIIGGKETELPAEHHFVKTIDMRPAINAIAELTFDYEATTGEAKWSIRSLDPMTMEPTKYMDDGVLPVNDETGRGTGYLVYDIDLLPNLADGTKINNSASIVFDDNKPISTPVWTNTTDYVLPTANITAKTTSDDTTFDFTVEGKDSGSGIWYYDLYVRQAGSEVWNMVKTQIETERFSYTSATKLAGAEFVVLATDRAGNRQDDAVLSARLGDADGNGKIDANDVVTIRNYYTGETTVIRQVNADVSHDGVIDTQDATATHNLYLEEQIKNKIQKTTRR